MSMINPKAATKFALLLMAGLAYAHAGDITFHNKSGRTCLVTVVDVRGTLHSEFIYSDEHKPIKLAGESLECVWVIWTGGMVAPGADFPKDAVKCFTGHNVKHLDDYKVGTLSADDLTMTQ